ncbi:MAG: GH36 C-terminal domain-containing protein [Verrucomicrobia bacterium]|nr:GH36 C-terminal domain-containing protein [Verrucomicrobiota bacterium]
MKQRLAIMALALAALFARAAEPAAITVSGNTWTLQNEAIQVVVSCAQGHLSLTRLSNQMAEKDYLKDQAPESLFSLVINGQTVTASDGGWTLAKADLSDIKFYGKTWGKRLELSLTRTQPVAFSVRQVFEIYNGRAGLRVLSFLKNGTDQPVTISASDVFALNLPDRPHTLHYVTGNLMWNATKAGVHRVGRNVITSYDTGDGWFVVPENNWATSLVPGPAKASAQEKLLYIHAWDNEPKVRVASNPNAVQLTLFPREELEYFSVNFGVFKGDDMDGRMAVAEHLRQRFKYHNPAHILSTNDWQWGYHKRRRTDMNYRDIVVPKAQAAGFDRVLIDDGWYAPDDSTTPARNWTDMAALGQYINDHGLKPGHWFSLQGRFCTRGWGEGRDSADPANIDFKLKQMQEDLIGKYHSSWDQVDAGLLWKTDTETAYSHPADSVYRKILGMKRYMNTIAHQHPDFIMQTTCEVDNPGGPGEEGLGVGTHGVGNQNVGLIQLADNGIMGMFRRSEYADDVRDLFAAFGLFPLEGMLSTHGEGKDYATAWQDSPLWYYQFLLARHTMIYSWPGDWSETSVAHLRFFNDWRKNPRIQSILNEGMLPVYNGADRLKNEGPWAWMFTNESKSQALLFALNHLNLTKNNAFAAKLRWLDPDKTYVVEEITQTPDGGFNYVFRGEYAGKRLVKEGLPIDLDDGVEPCAAFWIQEKTRSGPQVLYADAPIFRYTERSSLTKLAVEIEGAPNSTANLIVFKPTANAVEKQVVKIGPTGKATAVFDAATVTDEARPLAFTDAAPVTAKFVRRDVSTAGQWRGKYGSLAAWLAGQPIATQNGYALRPKDAATYVWGKDDHTPRVPELPAGATGSKLAACWTAATDFDLQMTPPKAPGPWQLTVYVMDYDNIRNPARALEISIRTRDGKVLDTQAATPAETGAGIYLTWVVSGPVTIHARKKEGFNAVVSGVFMDKGQRE